MRVSPGFANLFNNFEAPSGTKVPLIHEMYQVIYHTLCLGGSGGIWLTGCLIIFVAMLPYLFIEPIIFIYGMTEFEKNQHFCCHSEVDMLLLHLSSPLRYHHRHWLQDFQRKRLFDKGSINKNCLTPINLCLPIFVIWTLRQRRPSFFLLNPGDTPKM